MEKNKKVSGAATGEPEGLTERREFLILLSGGAALAGVGTLAGCDSGSPTGPDSSSSSSSGSSSESSESSSSSSSSESSESSSSDFSS